MNWYHKKIDEVFEHFHSQEKGLAETQISINRETFGSNRIITTKLTPFWKIFIAQFKDFVIWLLLSAALIALVLGETIDSIAIIAIVIINAIIGTIQEKKAQISLESLKKLSSPMARVLRDDEVIVIPAEDLVCGDIVLIEAGDYIPGDLRLFSANQLKIDESMLTGETLSVDKEATILSADELIISEQYNMAFMGTVVTSGKGKGVMIAGGMKTELGKITQMVQSIEVEATPLEQRMETLGRYIAIFCIIISFLVVSIGLFVTHDFIHLFMLGVSLSVAAIPEGLPAIITITLAIGVYRMVKRHALVRKLPAVETLGNVNTICSDKTGTLTLNQMFVNRITLFNMMEFEVTGKGFTPQGTITPISSKLSENPYTMEWLNQLLMTGLLCNDSELKPPSDKNPHWHVIGDPTEGALLALALKYKMDRQTFLQDYHLIYEIPFDNQKKYMATLFRHQSGKAYIFIKGAPDILLEHIPYTSDGQMLTQSQRDKISTEISEYSKSGLRCLGMAMAVYDSEKSLSIDNIFEQSQFIGFVSMYDPPRPEVLVAVKEAKEAGIKTLMITGDHKLTAFAIGLELGIADDISQVVTGHELENWDDVTLSNNIRQYHIFARTTPIHKLRIVQALKAHGDIVAMTGDGVNDAPALREAHIGIAMGLGGVDVARDSSDMVLTDDNYATIVAAVEEGRNIFANIKKSIYFILSHNVANILIVLGAIVQNLGLIVTPLQLLWINLITDSLPALSFSAENKEPDLMKKKPATSHRMIFTRIEYWRLFWQGSVNAFSAFLGYYLILHVFTRSDTSTLMSDQVARTVLFSIMVIGQQIYAFSCRSSNYSIFQMGFFSNIFLFGATGLAIILQFIAIYTPYVNNLFNIVPLNPLEIGVVIFCSLLSLFIIELAKIYYRYRSKKELCYA